MDFTLRFISSAISACVLPSKKLLSNLQMFLLHCYLPHLWLSTHFGMHGFVCGFEVLCGVWFSFGLYRDYMYKELEITLITEMIVGLVAGDNPKGLRSKLLRLLGIKE